MIKVENINVYNMDRAIYSMRNALESWDKSDSKMLTGELHLPTGEIIKNYPYKFVIGEKDLDLAQRLINGGQPHRKFLRQILCSMDITASMSFCWDIDTYKIATEKNSTSRMHKLTSKNCRHLTQQDMNWNELTPHRELSLKHYNELIDKLKQLRENKVPIMSEEYQKTFNELINDLPEGYLFTRHWTGNYEVLHELYYWRKDHKQEEIRDFCKIIETLPYAKELICLDKRNIENKGGK